MRNPATAPLRHVTACLTLAIISLLAVSTTGAQQVGVLSTNVTEKLKIKRCGTLTTNPYALGFLLHTNGEWDLVDIESGSVLSAIGTFAGPLDARKFTLNAGGLFTSVYISVLADAANSNCMPADIAITSHSPLNYVVKINKKRTVAKIKSEMKLRGYDFYSGRNGKGTYTLKGAGTYTIMEETAP